MRAEHLAGRRHDLARRVPSPAWRARNRALPVPARKHRSCESARYATGNPAYAASARTSGLVSSASGNRIRASDAGDSAASMYVWSLAGSAATRSSPSSVTRA